MKDDIRQNEFIIVTGDSENREYFIKKDSVCMVYYFKIDPIEYAIPEGFSHCVNVTFASTSHNFLFDSKSIADDLIKSVLSVKE